MFDIDNTICFEHGRKATPNEIPEEVRVAIRRLHDAGDQTMLVTGAPWDLSEKVAHDLDLDVPAGLKRAVTIAADYGSAVHRTDGGLDIMVNGFEFEAYTESKLRITRILQELGAVVDNRKTRYQTNAFWSDRIMFDMAEELLEKRLKDHADVWAMFNPHTRETGGGLLRWSFNESDMSVNILPVSANKGNAVRWAQLRKLAVRVAAGDTGNDRFILEAAEWPIVTLKEEGDEPNANLVKIVEKSMHEHGRGFIATRAHGLGLADGINAYLEWSALQTAKKIATS